MVAHLRFLASVACFEIGSGVVDARLCEKQDRELGCSMEVSD